VPAGLTLAPGQERTFAVRFTPVAAETSTAYWGLSTTAEAGTRMVPLAGRGEAPAVVPPPVNVPPVVLPPVVLPPVVLPPVDVPPPLPGVVPGVVSEGAPATPAKVRPGLTVSKPKVSHDGRTLAVRGFVAKAATGGLKVRLKAKAGRKTVTSVATIALRGKTTYAGTLVLPKAARAWTRLEVDVTFAGSSRVWPGAGGYVLVRPRAR
jgi:hypothetical protein